MKLGARISITQAVFAVTLAIAIAVAGPVILYARHQSGEEALIVADALMNQSIELLRLRADALIDPIDLIVAGSRDWPEIGSPPSTEGHPSRGRMIAMVRELPQVLHVYLGYQDGDYFQIRQAGQVDPERLRELGAPEGTAFVEDVVLRAGRPQAEVVRRFLDRDGTTLQTSTGGTSEFDPRTRPWYRDAMATDGVARTDVYTFQGDDIPGLSVIRRHDRGVMGVDITLRELGRFLGSMPQARHGLLAIFQESGRILARTSPDSPADRASQGSVLSALIHRAVQDPSFEAGLTEVAGESWIARLAHIGLGGNATERLLVAMPVAEIVAPIDAVSRGTLIVSLLILAVSIPLVWLVSRRVSRPLLRLAAEADAIRRFELSESEPLTSFVEEIARLQRAVLRMRAGLRTFSVYVPKALVRQLVAGGQAPELGGTRRDLSVIFVDLENFTALAARLEPEEVMSLMSRYFEVITQTLLAHDATIDKYIGDSVMAFWNAPGGTPDHAARACRAALDIVEAARRETESWVEDDAPALRTRIGLHCGEAIVGNVGSSDRMNYTALGATVNLAARLEPLNRELGTDILVSRDVVSRVEDRFAFRSAGTATLKGFSEPVEVFELTGTLEP